MGKHVSILTNIITALSIWWVGVLGGAMVIILPCQFIYWLVTHLYQKARGDDYLWILTVLIASFLVRNRISYGKIVWKALLVISIVLFFIPFLQFTPNLTQMLVSSYKSQVFVIVLMVFLSWVAFYVFRYSFFASVFVGLYISKLWFNPTRSERKNFDIFFEDFSSKYTLDMLNISHIKKPWTVWKLFFWRPKTIEELAKDKILEELVDTYKMNKIKEEAQKEEELKKQVAKKAEEIKAKFNIKI